MNVRNTIVLASLSLAGTALAHHHHLTVDTVSTADGPKAVIIGGYYPTEPDVSIAPDGRVTDGDRFLAVDAIYDLAQPGPFDGWAGSDELLLTSDYFYATGRLDGGDFRYEIVSVELIGGDPSELAWGHFDEDTGQFVADALSTGATRAERSIDVGAGQHDHTQALTMSAAYGAYDVTLVAWDANGVYADSDPVIVRIAVHPCPSDFDRNAFVNGADFDSFIEYFIAGDEAADFDENTFVNGDDFDHFVEAFYAGC